MVPKLIDETLKQKLLKKMKEHIAQDSHFDTMLNRTKNERKFKMIRKGDVFIVWTSQILS